MSLTPTWWPALLLGLSALLLSSAGRGELAPPGTSPDRLLVDVAVRPGDTCETIAERLYGHRRFYYVLVEHLPDVPNVLRTTCDRALRPGATIRLPRRPPEGSQPPDAKVSAVVREVRSRAPAAPIWGKAHTGQGLFRGWRVNTLERSEAELTFSDDSRVHLREETLVIIFGPTSREARRRTSRASLERGALRARLAELSGRAKLDVLTPTARAVLHGGEAVVSVDAQKTSRVANHSGRPARVMARKGGGEILLRAGMGTTIRRGKRPSPPRPLLGPPQWLEGSSLFITLPGLLPSRVFGSWQPVTGARHYRVELTAGSDGSSPAGATGVPAEVQQFELRGLPPGTYYVALSSQDERELEGPVGERREIRVVAVDIEPPGLGEPSTVATAEPGVQEPPSFFVGSRIRPPPGMRCGLGEDSTREELVLSGHGVVTLHCFDQSGRSAPRILLRVLPLDIVPRAAEEQSVRELRRGESVTLRLDGVTIAGRRVQDFAAVAGPGLRVDGLTASPDGELSVTLTAAGDAPRESYVELHLRPANQRRVVLGRIPFGLDASLPPRPTSDDEPPAQPDHGPQHPPALETTGLLIGPDHFGVRDEQRRGSGLWASFELAPTPDEPGHVALALGLRLAFFNEMLRVTAGVPMPTGAGPWGASLGVASLILSRSRLGLAFELAAWLPFSRDSRTDRWALRLVPTADLSFRVGHRWLLRTRQGLMADASQGGLLAWASAYSADFRLVGPLTLGLELSLLLGRADDDFLVSPATTLALGVSLGPLLLTLGGRVSMSGEAQERLGAFALVFTFRSGNRQESLSGAP